MRTAAIMILLVASLLAGCADSGSDDTDPTTAPNMPIVPTVSDLPCEAEVGDGTSENLRILSNVSFEDAYSRDIDIAGNLLLSPGGNGMGIIDITNPEAPEVLGELRGIGGELDIKFSPDNNTAILGVDNGMILVDIRDPMQPEIESYWNFSDAPGAPDLIQDPANAQLLNGHMVYAERIADRDWVFLAPNSNSGVWIFEMVGEPGSRTLEYITQTMPLTGSALGPHDMWVTYDEVEQAWLLYSADSFEGWTVYNIDDPANPAFAGGLVRPETGYTHTIQAGWVDDRRIVATIQEVGVNTLEVYDATNLMAPVLLATWAASAEELVQPQHNIQIVNGTLWMAHYSLGVFAFDLRDAGSLPVAGTATLNPIAYFDAGMEHGAPAIDFAGVYDVVIKDGLVYISGYSGSVRGVTVVAYGCYMPGDESLTSTG